MRLPWKKDLTPGIDEQIKAVLDEMTTEGVDSEEYSRYLTHLERLTDLKTGNRPAKMSRDMLGQIFGNLAGILIVVIFEQKGTITSKAFGEIIRARGSKP